MNIIDDSKGTTDILSNIKKIHVENKKLSDEIYNLQENLFDVDCRLIEVEQYSRRENLIISGIPDSVPQRDLEKKCYKY